MISSLRVECSETHAPAVLGDVGSVVAGFPQLDTTEPSAALHAATWLSVGARRGDINHNSKTFFGENGAAGCGGGGYADGWSQRWLGRRESKTARNGGGRARDRERWEKDKVTVGHWWPREAFFCDMAPVWFFIFASPKLSFEGIFQN
jgi:hypothetical protein